MKTEPASGSPAKRTWRPLGNLRVRITLAMLALAAVGSTVFAFGIFMGAERLEQSVLDRHVRAEFDTLARESRADPSLATVHSALLLGYVGRDNPELPSEFADLSAGGFHAVDVGDKIYQVYVGEDGGRRLYVGYDITEWEALEQPVINTLIAGVVLSSLLAIALGFWTSAQIIAPVTALSKRLQDLDPRRRGVRIAAEFTSAEVARIAESFDRYMERLDGFVEREQLFTAAAAHELRTPLAVIQGATDVLAEQGDLPPAAQRATARLQRATRDMREFIEALLFLSREKNDQTFDHASCDVSQIARQLVEDYARLVERKPVTLKACADAPLRLDVPPALPTIVLSNLLRNAVEHTPAGTIHVAVEDGRLRITDTGAGISPEAQSLLFDRDYSTKRGGGMGLHLTTRICDRFGWQLTVASTPGKGTTVGVDFSGSRIGPARPGC
jgi:signal transduction histidine kinase